MILPATPRSECLAEHAAAGAVDRCPQTLYDSLRMEAKRCRSWRMVPRLLLWPLASVHEEADRLGHVVQRALLTGLVHLDGDPQGMQTLRPLQIFQLNVLKP